MGKDALGVLVLVVGSDRVTAQIVVEAARRYRGSGRIVFPRRVVSGPPLALGEVHQTVTPAQFEELRRNGVFGLVWGSGGRNFALPASISDDLRNGRIVVAAAALSAVHSATRDFARAAVAVAGDVEDPATRRMLVGCEEVTRLGDDPSQAAAHLAKFISELYTTKAPLSRPAETWTGGSVL